MVNTHKVHIQTHTLGNREMIKEQKSGNSTNEEQKIMKRFQRRCVRRDSVRATHRRGKIGKGIHKKKQDTQNIEQIKKKDTIKLNGIGHCLSMRDLMALQKKIHCLYNECACRFLFHAFFVMDLKQRKCNETVCAVPSFSAIPLLCSSIFYLFYLDKAHIRKFPFQDPLCIKKELARIA